ncbi:MAG: hypothetical protein WDM86_07145 [Rhizomicrobium sp.]
MNDAMGPWIETLFERARARRLDRIAATYAVGGWLLVQAASIALPAFDAPPWALRWLIVASVVGFPLALIAGWTLNRDSAVPGAPLKGREAVFLGAIALVAVLSLGELALYWSAATPAAPPPAESGAPPRSVAVLPFDNLGGDPKEKYFSEGVSDELIGLLARNPALRVVARTSSFFFEGKEQDIRVIAQKLNVRSVLEGSVRQDGERVRIEVSLVNAADGYQLWSQSYDRSLSDILAVQADIAQSIATALAPKLTGENVQPRIPKPAQIDPDIYRDYLQGQVYFDQRLTERQTPASRDALDRAVALFRKVVAAAPDFADGQAALASALRYENVDVAQIQQAIARALALDPENPGALTVAIDIALNAQDWDAVIRDVTILRRTGQHTALGAQGLATAYEAFDFSEAALAEHREWARLDPFSNPAWQGVARDNFVLARFADAVSASDEALALHPGDPVTLQYKCVSLAFLKRIAEARAVLGGLSAPGIPAQLATHCKFFILLNSEGAEPAVAFVQDVLKHDPTKIGDPGDLGFMLSHAGADDQAMDSYEKALSDGAFIFGFYPGRSTPAAFLQTPRWIALTQTPAFRAWSEAREAARRAWSPDAP